MDNNFEELPDLELDFNGKPVYSESSTNNNVNKKNENNQLDYNDEELDEQLKILLLKFDGLVAEARLKTIKKFDGDNIKILDGDNIKILNDNNTKLLDDNNIKILDDNKFDTVIIHDLKKINNSDVFGSEFHIENLPLGTPLTIFPEFDSLLTLKTDLLCGGEYKIEWTLIVKIENTIIGEQGVYLKIEIDDMSTHEVLYLAQNIPQKLIYSGFTIKKLMSRSYTINIMYCVDKIGKQKTIPIITNVELILYRVR